MKYCTRPVVLTLTVSWPFWKVTKNLEFFCINFSILYHEWGSLCGHHNSLNRLTLTFDHDFNSYQGWCSCAQDLLLWPLPFFDALKGHKQLRFFPLFTMDARLNAGGFDSVGVTLLLLLLLSPAAPKARDGRYCNAPPSVCLSVRPSCLVFAL